MYLKNPTSSKKIERKVIEINNTKILIGLTLDDDVNPLSASLNEMLLKTSINNPPIKPTIQ